MFSYVLYDGLYGHYVCDLDYQATVWFDGEWHVKESL